VRTVAAGRWAIPWRRAHLKIVLERLSTHRVAPGHHGSLHMVPRRKAWALSSTARVSSIHSGDCMTEAKIEIKHLKPRSKRLRSATTHKQAGVGVTVTPWAQTVPCECQLQDHLVYPLDFRKRWALQGDLLHLTIQRADIRSSCACATLRPAGSMLSEKYGSAPTEWCAILAKPCRAGSPTKFKRSHLGSPKLHVRGRLHTCMLAPYLLAISEVVEAEAIRNSVSHVATSCLTTQLEHRMQ
jgi:hypothetical protein